jgi:hypothetical protein
LRISDLWQGATRHIPRPGSRPGSSPQVTSAGHVPGRLVPSPGRTACTNSLPNTASIAPNLTCRSCKGDIRIASVCPVPRAAAQLRAAGWRTQRLTNARARVHLHQGRHQLHGKLWEPPMLGGRGTISSSDFSDSVSVCASACLSLCLFFCLSVWLSGCLSVCLHLMSGTAAACYSLLRFKSENLITWLKINLKFPNGRARE